VKTKTVLKRKLLGEKPSDWASGYSAELALLLAVCAPPLPRLLLAAVVIFLLLIGFYFQLSSFFLHWLLEPLVATTRVGKKKWKQIFKRPSE
jgi:hypothetical protein